MFAVSDFNDKEESFHGKNNSSCNDTSTDDGSSVTAQLQGNIAAPTGQNSFTIDHNENTPLPEANDEIATLMAQVNDSLERELKETKKAVKRIFKEIVTFHKVSKSVHELWAPIQRAEHQESLRLDELQAEVQGAIGAYSVPMGNITNSNNSTDMHVPSK